MFCFASHLSVWTRGPLVNLSIVKRLASDPHVSKCPNDRHSSVIHSLAKLPFSVRERTPCVQFGRTVWSLPNKQNEHHTHTQTQIVQGLEQFFNRPTQPQRAALPIATFVVLSMSFSLLLHYRWMRSIPTCQRTRLHCFCKRIPA